MSYCITNKMIEKLALRLNKLAGTPEVPCKRGDNGELEWQEGHYHISYAYGGACLHQITAGGGVCDIFHCGHVSKRDLYNRISAFIDGYQAAKDDAS